MIFELAGDFSDALAAMPAEHPKRRLLELLEEAIRRDIHFIDRHPTTLFQCMWNTCWWYDCPEAADHYEWRDGDWSELPPWEERGTKVHRFLEEWRTDKEAKTHAFRWMRSLRPPARPLAFGQVAILRGHERWVTSIAFSADSRCIISGSEDETIRVWDIQDVRELRRFGELGEWILCLAYSPVHRQLAAGSMDGTVMLLDSQTGEEVRRFLGHEDRIWSVAFSPDGRRIASGSEDGSARVWDAESGQVLLCLRGHEDGVESVAFSPDGTQLLSGSRDKTVRAYEMPEGEEHCCLRGDEFEGEMASFGVPGTVDFLRSYRGSSAGVTSVAYSDDGRHFVCGSFDGTAQLWDLDTQMPVLWLRGHQGVVWSAAVSPDGKRIVTGSRDRTLRIWDRGNGNQLRCFCGHEGEVTQVAYSPDGRYVASSSTDRTIRVWDPTIRNATPVLRGIHGHILCVAYSPDGERVAAGGVGTVQQWDARSGEIIGESLARAPSVVWSLAYSPDSSQLIGGLADGTLHAWDAKSGEELFCFRGHKGWVESVAYSQDGRRIICDSFRERRVWDVGRGKCVERIVFNSLFDRRRLPDTNLAFRKSPVDAYSYASETVISGKQGAIGWFPVSLYHIADCPTRRAWAGAWAGMEEYSGYLCIFGLEGCAGADRRIADR